MRPKALSLMQMMSSAINADEALAEKIDQLAVLALEEVWPDWAVVLRGLVRNHRIRAMEMRGRMEIARAQHPVNHHRDL